MNNISNDERIELAIALATADSESGVVETLENFGLWEDPENWRNYGDIENNFSSIGNQMDSADTALTEKLINSGDSMLMAACMDAGVDPESPQAPQSISDALRKFFNVREGVISYLSEEERIELSRSIGLVATGRKSRPCLTVFDHGLGQSPSQFPDTFLSLNASNKIRIPFVQGKFNMGSTGALLFCGQRNLQLILSKKRQSLASKYDDGGLWGLTVVRRDPPAGGMKSSVYRYLAPDNGNVVSFSSDGLAILPEDGMYDKPYCRHMEYGTFVKMYDYDIGPGLRTNIILDLYNRLNLLLPRMYMPVRVYERRPGYSAHSYETTLSGLSTRVDLDRNENLEPNFPTSASISINGIDLHADIYAFKKREKGTAKDKYAKNEGIVFSINGQAHGFLTKDFFSRRSVGMDYLANSLLVHVDCSQIDGTMREDLFINSRDRLRNGALKKSIESKLESIINKHEGLRELRERRKREALSEQISDDKPLAEILEDLLKDSKVLADFLLSGKRLANPFRMKNEGEVEEFSGRQFPTFYTPTHPHPADKPRVAEIGRTVRLQFNTDAENQYFTRDIEPGRASIACSTGEELSWDDNLWNGRHNISIDLPNSVSPGDLISLTITVSDDSRPEPFVNEVFMKVEPKTSRKKSKAGKRKRPPSTKTGNGTETSTHLALPEIYPVAKKNWGDHGFDKFSGLRVVDNGENGYDYYYNCDNAYLRHEQKTAKDQKAEVLDVQFKTALVLFGMSIMADQSIDDEDRPKLAARVSKALAPIVLPMINGLGIGNIE